MTTLPERPDQSPITSPRSERVRRIAALAGRSARRKQGRIRVEGPQAVRSLLTERSDDTLELHLTAKADAQHPELADLARTANVPVRPTDERILAAMVREPGTEGTLVSPQGVVAIAHQPASVSLDAVLGGAGHVAARDSARPVPSDGSTDTTDQVSTDAPLTLLVLHEVRDPGNVGTLIRTSDAAGADAVILTKTCADPYAPKVIRASVGSVFHLPLVLDAHIDQVLTALAAKQVTAVATSGYADRDLYDTDLPERIAWIMGNEAQGLDAETLAAAPLAVRIPLVGRAESLNVHTAATVCLFETLRRRPRAGHHGEGR